MKNLGTSKNLICILYNKGKNQELTDDCRLRIEAGLKLWDKNAKICYVGAETEVMKRFYSNEEIIELNQCHSTFGNIREIFKFIQNQNFGKIIIISNNYHLNRIKLFLRRFKLNWEVRGAENVLKIKSRRNFGELIKYPIDFCFRRKID
jgi:uncharacterized SAM-binding protein YcdF (DUF218 family)